MADILVKHLVKRFGKVEAVSDVSLQIADGEFLVLLGPSGCGKSTILRVVAGLEDADSGEIVIGGRLVNFIDPVKRNVAMVFQNYALYPHMSVYKNIAFPLQIAKKRKDEVEVAVRRAAGMLGLEELLQRLPCFGHDLLPCGPIPSDGDSYRHLIGSMESERCPRRDNPLARNINNQ